MSFGSEIGASGALRFAPARGRTGGSSDYGMQYPSPFFDIGHTYLPSTVKQMFRWCRYYFLVNPLINAVVFKMSEYPITDILFDTERLKLKEKWQGFLLDHLRYRAFQVEIGLDYHCFHGDVKATTKDGVFRLRDLVGKTAQVLSKDGVYRPATFVESLGKQELLEVAFRDGSTVLATPTHQWPVITSSGNTIKVPTTELKGRSIPRNVAPRPEKNDDYYEGVRHGFVFGDGTLYNDGEQARACFFGTKDQEMLKYFEGCGSPPYRETGGNIFIHGMPPSYKQLPENSSSASYWYGFVSGFLAADDSVDVAGCTVLTQRNKAALGAISDQLPRIGMVGGKLRGYDEETPYGDGTTYVLSLFKQYMEPGDFLLSHHKAKFEDNYKPTTYGTHVTVVDVRRTGLFEKVFCAMEPETKTFTIDNGVLTGNTYGNALVSIFYPFVKMLECKECHYKVPARDANYRFQSNQFYTHCPKCGHHGPTKAYDRYIKAPKGIRLLRWNPEDVDIRYNDITGEYEYYYQIPVQLRNDILIGKKSTVETVPQLFIDALRLKKAVVFSRDNIYHFKRPTLAGKDRGWGTPMILPVLKDTFYLQILRKAQECVALSSLMETKNGLLKADDVDVGMQVRTHTGQWQLVEKKWYRDAREGEVGRKITLTGLRSLGTVYSPHHPIFTLRRNEENHRVDTKDSQRSSVILRNLHLYEEVLCPAEQLEVGQYVLYPRKLPTHSPCINVAEYTGLTATEGYVYSGCGEETARAFEALESGDHVSHDNAGRVAKRALKEGRTPKRMVSVRAMTADFAYILGWYAGDGSCGSRHVDFSLGKDNDSRPLMDAIRREFGVEPTIEEGESINTVVLSDTIIRLLVKGMVPGTARDKQAPIEILNGTDEVKLSYLRGLWDADGYEESHKASVTTVSRNQAYDAYRLLLHFGCIATVDKLRPSFSIINDREVRGSGSYNVNVCDASFDRLRSLWECGDGPEVVSGKSGFFWKEYFASRICAIEEVEEEQYIDFKIANDTTFCTPGTATKNSIALEHIVPLRILFPQAGSATSDPYCLSLDSLVETREGIMPAGEVGQGVFLKTHSGAWKRVEYAIDRPIRDGEKAYKFTIASLSAFPFTVSEEHPLLTAKRPPRFRGYDSIGEPEFTQAQDVQEGDFVCYPRRRITWDRMELDLHDYHPERACTEEYLYRRLNQEAAEIYEFFEREGVPEFGHGEKILTLDKHGWSDQNYTNARAAFTQQEQIDRIPRYLEVTEGLSYLVGLYAAEGSPKESGASLALSAAEDKIMDRVDRVLLDLGFPTGHRHIRGKSAQYDIDDIFIGGLLQQMCGRGAQNKHFPRFLLEAPDQIALRAVEGVFVGDGCSIHTTTRREGLKTVSPRLAVDVRILLLSQGLISTVQRSIPRDDEISKLPYYQVNLNGSQGDELQRVFLGLRGTSGFSRCGFMRGDYVYLRVNKRDEAPEVRTVRGFQIEGDKSFCVVGVATHNTSVNLQDWRDQIAGELRRWRSDNNYIPIMPLPLGNQTIGGDGRALLLSQEIRVWSEQIVAGMGIPVELVFGGLSYSGSNVSLRMLENTFLGYLQDHLTLLKWIIKNTGSYLGWSPVRPRFKPFKMADDLQRKAYLFQLNQANKLSDESLLADADYDSSKEDMIMERESTRRVEAQKKRVLQDADMQGEAQMVSMKWQMKLQSQQEKHQMAMQTEAMKEQMATQGEQQKQMMMDQMAMQQGQPPSETPPEQQPSPRHPELLEPPPEIQSPLTARSVRPLAPNTTGEDLMGQQNVDVLLMGRQLANRINTLPPLVRPRALAQLKAQQPELHDVVLGLMVSGGPSQAAAAAARPLPEQKPARRDPESQLV